MADLKISQLTGATTPLVAGAVEILRFAPDLFFSGLASEETTLYITPGEGI